MSRRVLKRPPQGWANHSPNYALADMLAMVGFMLGSALFFTWASAAFQMVLEAAGLA